MKHPADRHSASWVGCSLAALLLFIGTVPVGAQEYLTAPELFDTVSRNYSEITDYVGRLRYSDETGSMSGTIYHKEPNMIRIDFDEPEDQVLVSNGEVFMLYIPPLNVVLQQELRGGTVGVPGDLATGEGLSLMRRNFDIAYLEGPELLPLDEDSDTFVTKLRLDAKQVSEGYRQLVLSITEDGYIRRIVGTKVDWEEVQLDLTDMQFNQSIPETRFDYEPEASASVNENFLFEPED